MALHPLPKQNDINRLNKAFTELYHDICVQLGISDSVFDIFYAIAALGDGCCQRDICDYAFTSKQTIHSAIHKLEKEGFLRFMSGKGREMLIFLTPAGERFMEEKITPVIAMENAVLSQIPPDEIDQLIYLTEKCLNGLRTQSNQLFKTAKKK